jgi:hypothetical protein
MHDWILCVDCSCLDTAAEWMSSSVSARKQFVVEIFFYVPTVQENDNNDRDSALDAAKQTI